MGLAPGQASAVYRGRKGGFSLELQKMNGSSYLMANVTHIFAHIFFKFHATLATRSWTRKWDDDPHCTLPFIRQCSELLMHN